VLNRLSADRLSAERHGLSVSVHRSGEQLACSRTVVVKPETTGTGPEGKGRACRSHRSCQTRNHPHRAGGERELAANQNAEVILEPSLTVQGAVRAPPGTQRCRAGAGHYRSAQIGNVVGRGWGALFHTSPGPPRAWHVGEGDLLAKRLSAAVANHLIHHPGKLDGVFFRQAQRASGKRKPGDGATVVAKASPVNADSLNRPQVALRCHLTALQPPIRSVRHPA
jgi:hypothetical protein